uniref:MARVEL domain-containing protein n=1 Tax=Rhabditophanes sp. KR3021 TaxID=114890 RepID=A0AC35U4A8_9BILA
MPFSRLEFGYASLFSLLSLINMIITMTWLNYSFDGKLGISALFCFTSMFVYGINAVIAFKTFNGNGAFLNHQEGSGQIVGGDIENMHSGI